MGQGYILKKIPGPGSEIAGLTRSHYGPGQKTRGFEFAGPGWVSMGLASVDFSSFKFSTSFLCVIKKFEVSFVVSAASFRGRAARTPNASPFPIETLRLF